jgi:Cu-Zn family superoxide dismutase
VNVGGTASVETYESNQLRPTNKEKHMRFPRTVIGISAAIGLTAVTLGVQANNASASDHIARARLTLADGTKIGSVRFWDDEHGGATIVKVRLSVPVGSAAPGAFHGFHIHANNDPANGEGCVVDPVAAASTWFVSADGHFKHDAAETHGGHAGDLPTIYLDANGHAEARFTIDRVMPSELPGTAVILHAGADNYGNVPLGTGADQYTANSDAATAKTGNTGNAGDRVACGVIR